MTLKFNKRCSLKFKLIDYFIVDSFEIIALKSSTTLWYNNQK